MNPNHSTYEGLGLLVIVSCITHTHTHKTKSRLYFFRLLALSRELNILRQTNKQKFVFHTFGSIYTEKVSIENKINSTQTLS